MNAGEPVTNSPVNNEVEIGRYSNDVEPEDSTSSERLPWITLETWNEGNITNDDCSNEESKSVVNAEASPNQVQRTRYGRSVKPKKRLGTFSLAFLTAEAMCCSVGGEVLTSAENAISTSEEREWKSAKTDEIVSLSRNRVFRVTPRPRERKVVKYHWVFAKKTYSKGEVY